MSYIGKQVDRYTCLLVSVGTFLAVYLSTFLLIPRILHLRHRPTVVLARLHFLGREHLG
jgi:hypothetical protein